jgi:hypothetical protein
MSPSTSKAWLLALCAIAVAFVSGWWIGEGPGWPLPFVLVGLTLHSENAMYASFAVAVVVLAVIVAPTIQRVWPSVWMRRLVSIAAVLSLASGVWLGGKASARAFNECVQEADGVRDQIVAFRSARGRYPEQLRELPDTVPCQRPLRGSLLSYTPSGNGFRLEFHDWLVRHEGNEQHGMDAIQ